MAYESLYRRYRPQRFSEVRGQDHVVTALHNAVRENRVGHAYLLSGPRGTGKTSTARILAKALNCTNLDDGEPCGECDACQAIEAGTSYDLLELDAASNNGVDAMRDLIAKAALGSPGRTKVYLLDEVHMLSAGASNALLKTLEEPPGHVVFVLATTDPHKVLPTIRSRTQHFELHLLPAEDLRALVDEVVSDAGLELGADAIEYALRTGGGSARDTLSALDQVVAAGGVLDRGDEVDGLIDALGAGDTGAALRAVADAVGRGHDPRVVAEALLAGVRNVFLHRMGDPLEHTSDAARAKVTEWAEHFSDRDCTRALESIGEALRDMRSAPDARIPLEVALVRLTRDGADSSLDALVARVERLEQGAPRAATPDGTAHAPAPGRSRPVEPVSGGRGGRPADAARAALASRQPAEVPAGKAGDSGSPPPRPPSTPDSPSRPPATPATNTAPTPEPAAAASPAREQAPADPEPSDTQPSSTESSSTEGLPSVAELTQLWETQVLPQLSGLTKAMFSVGSFVEVTSSGTAVFAVPNAVHREKSTQKLPEVEAALTARLGRTVRFELVVEGSTGSSNPGTSGAEGRSRTTGADSESSGQDEDEDVGPVAELEDAPNDARSATDRIVDTFPGTEIVDG